MTPLTLILGASDPEMQAIEALGRIPPRHVGSGQQKSPLTVSGAGLLATMAVCPFMPYLH